jgi:RNA polymerase subunit RPABC4/transcription elongation factor Spt4
VNINFAGIIKRIIDEQGEDILANPQRMKGFVSDYAAAESKPERLALGRCIEHGAYTELKNAPDAVTRQRVKATLAQRVRSNEGMDLGLCNDALDVLEAAMFDGKNFCQKCGKELQEDWKACPYCGAGQTPSVHSAVPVIQAKPSAQATALPRITLNFPVKKKHMVQNGLIAAGAIATQFKYTTEGDKIIITGSISRDTIINIPVHIGGLPVTSIGDRAFLWNRNLSSITIPNGVTSIGICAFADCISLSLITIPNGITSIGRYTFSGCRSLSSITIPNGVRTIGRGAFFRCSNLSLITIPNSVMSIGEAAFFGCDKLATADKKSIRRRFGRNVF